MNRINSITMHRHLAEGRYADVLDAAEILESTYGSAVNAIAAMCRDSELYRKAISERDASGTHTPGPTASDRTTV